MLDGREVLVQLVTRIPKRLHRRLRVHCVSAGTTVMAVTAEAICDELARMPRLRNRRRRVPVA
jgi:hypothetical protein